MKDRLLKAFYWLSKRMNEPSSWKGVTLIVSAGGWHHLDSSNKGEVIMQVGIIVFGLIQVFMSQESQYKVKSDAN